MGWSLLLSGIAVNVAGIIGIKFGQYLNRSEFSVTGYLIYFVGFAVLSLSFKHLEMGRAYAVWSGLGSLSVLTFGILFFGESLSPGKLGFFVLIMVGVIGISLTS